MKTTAFFLSDRTGITVETLGHTLISHFDTMEFTQIQRPYLHSPKEVAKVAKEIENISKNSSLPVLVFSSLVSAESRALLQNCNCVLFDIYNMFIEPMEKSLKIESSHQAGLSHAMGTFDNYKHRIDALNFTLENDDGENSNNYQMADVIIIGVSRTGKTPTSLYLALNYEIRTANYPLITEDLSSEKLPAILTKFQDKLFGLTINPVRLHHIRQERRANSKYSELSQCQYEIRTAEVLYKKYNIPFMDTSTMSIEEIATSILHSKKIQRQRDE
ncbi:MAG: kinase/pyrophosphorylase [Gammaproteobacteria bacterium]|nr:kinase/pyrophosphorylase [Gammaproteobacteria bacterium]